MARVLMVCSKVDHWIDGEFDRVIGVDKGALAFALKAITMDVAIGDFDSITPKQLDLVKKYSKQVVVLPKEKDETDAQAALAYTKESDEVILIGGLGYRLDHQYVNMQLMLKHPQVQLWDKNNRIMIVDHSTTIKKETFTYVSLFALEPTTLSFTGVKYPLVDVVLNPEDLYGVSNEIIDHQAQLTIVKGRVIMMLTSD